MSVSAEVIEVVAPPLQRTTYAVVPKETTYYGSVQPQTVVSYQERTYGIYAPQFYDTIRRTLLEGVATGIFVFGVVTILTLHAYMPILFTTLLTALSIGLLTMAIAAVFRRYGAGYLNPLVVLACAFADWKFVARGAFYSKIIGKHYDKKDKYHKSHNIGMNFWAYILAEGAGAALGSLLVWAVWANIWPAFYGFQPFNTAIFDSGRIFVLDMLLYAFLIFIDVISGRKRKTIGKFYPLIVGAYQAVIMVATAITSHGLYNIVIWLSTALLSDFGGAGVLSAAATDGWLVFGANAAAGAIAILLCMFMPHKLGKNLLKAKKHMTA